MSNAKGRVDAGSRGSTRFSSPLARLKKENSPLDVTNIPIFTQAFFFDGNEKGRKSSKKSREILESSGALSRFDRSLSTLEKRSRGAVRRPA
jgi:hypothetical protein